MRVSATNKNLFAIAVVLILIWLGACTQDKKSRNAATQPPATRNAATQVVETAQLHVTFAEATAAGYRDSALRQGAPEKEINCVMSKITPEFGLPVLAKAYGDRCSDDELQEAILFFQSETGKTYIRNERMRVKVMLGMSTEEPPQYSPGEEDDIVAFEETKVGKLVTSQDPSIREEVREIMRPQLIAIFDQCKN